MKKSILTAFILLGAIGLMAQGKKADSAAKPKPRLMHRLYTHTDSVKMKQPFTHSTTTPVEDMALPNLSRLHTPMVNDVIDVEHEIK